MNRYFTSLPVLAMLAASALSSTAFAGGFSRGGADTSILYETGNFDARFGGLYVAPRRTYDTISGTKSTDGSYSNDYFSPSAAIKFAPIDNFSCALTYSEPFGGSTAYGAQAIAAGNLATAAVPGNAATGNGTKSIEFLAQEYAATCAVNAPVGSGRAYLIGGVYQQTFNYTEVANYGTLKLTDSGETGFRVGAAYTIDEYAMRAEVMYRSQIKENASGSFTTSAVLTALKGIAAGTSLSATGNGTLPQSLRVYLQTGVAPGWLVYGSVEWTQWSVLQSLNYSITGLGAKTKDYFYKDGWTITAGVGHAFNEDVSGTVNLTWDRGVGTGADISTDTWTLGTGASIKAGPGQLKLGGGVTYLTAGSQTAIAGKTYSATVGGDWAVALGASYQVKF
jgi:long-chain fatty acid transport protein